MTYLFSLLAVNFTVSGHSAGGSIASLHAIAFSNRVLGLGHFEAAPYGCASLYDGSEEYGAGYLGYNDACIGDEASQEMASAVQTAFDQGKIDDPENLQGMPIFVASGGKDTIVNASVNTAAAIMYSEYLGAIVNLTEIADAQHSLFIDQATKDECLYCSDSCSHLGEPYINNCNFSDAKHALLHIYREDLSPPIPWLEDNIITINQSAFFPRINTTANATAEAEALQMSETAFAYVPSSCKGDARSCRVHVQYHGCGCSQMELLTGMTFVKHTGFNGWAEANAIMVLYPQSWGISCWNWDGEQAYDPGYDTNQSLQLTVVNRMIEALAYGVIV